MSSASDIEKSDALSTTFFTVLSPHDPNPSARLGKLSITERQDLNTPDFLFVGSRGVVPHLTPDVMSQHTKIEGVHMALEDFIERATKGTPPILNVPGSSPLHTFTALSSSLITLLAPRRTPAVAAPNGNSNTSISIFTSSGFQTLSNKSYITYIKKLHPDIAIALADISHGTVPGTKRVAKMADRTQVWLLDLLSEKEEGSAIFAPILPLDSLDQSEYLNQLDDIANDIAGLAFYDSSVLPDIPATTALSQLPRLSLDEPTSPHHILRQISLGMDIFTIPFVGFATDAGIALTFRFPRPLPFEDVKSDQTGTKILPLGIDMWSTEHSKSVIPLSTSCECYTCSSHHRAYVQHLLSAKEMLGWALIQIHNHHILSEFFTSIRQSIKERSFEMDCNEFGRVYENELPEKSGQGPRIRGYHFKSEGPGEKKKNKAAWGNLGTENTDVSPVDVAADELEQKGFAENVSL